MAKDGTTRSDSQTQLISPRRFARQVGMSYALALRLVHSGEIPSLACGTRRRINSIWVSRWLDAALQINSSSGPGEHRGAAAPP